MAHIGLTYDLRSHYLALGMSELDTAEFDRDETVDAIEHALGGLGHTTVRIGTAQQLVERLAAGERWDLVFNICEGLNGRARESQVPCILDVYGIEYTFADAAVMALCLNKAWCKAVVRHANIATAPYVVVEHLDDLRHIDMALPLFAKPIAEGTGKGVDGRSIITRSEQLAPVCRDLLERFQQPVLVEAYLPGREFTVGLLGTGSEARVLGTFEIVLRANAEAGVYSYINKEECDDRVDYLLAQGRDDIAVQQAERLALNAWRALGGRDAGRIDVRLDAFGRPAFIEANPLAGLHPQHSDLPMVCTAIGMSFRDLVDGITRSALARVAPGNVDARRAAV